MTLQLLSEYKSYGGRQLRYSHWSTSCQCTMTFSIYLPPRKKNTAETKPAPLLYWLSGLTCTDENFVQKAGSQAHAAKYGIAIVAPDTSPRGEGVPDDPQGAYDFGLGAGFYLNATQTPWSKNYRMYDYVTDELPKVLHKNFAVDPQTQSICGHSMGGHGALTIALKNPGKFQSVSAFAPVVSPSQVPWGIKALGMYLGEDQSTWKTYDTCCLIPQAQEKLPLLIDQGEADTFLKDQLQPHRLEDACKKADHPLTLRRHPGYDHSYFFIATFLGDHMAHHAKAFGLL